MLERLVAMIRPASRYLLAVWTLAIILVSSVPSVPVLKIHTAKTVIRLDYLIHFCEYGILAFMAYLSFAGNDFKMSYRKFILITFFLISFAVLDEFHQKFIPGRAFNAKDILSDIAGILAVLIFCLVLFRNMANKTGKFDQD